MINQNLKDKVCIVTGANSGMGKIIASSLADQGATLIMVCRIIDKPGVAFEDIRMKTKNPNIELMVTDLSSQKEIRLLAERIKAKYPVIHILVNNAGCMNFGYSETLDGIETTFATNHLAYFLLTNLLLDNIKSAPEARIINVTSDAEKNATLNLEDLNMKNNYSSFKAYAQSKLANILFTYELARKLKNTKITVNCVHPGIVPNTKLGKGSKAFANFIASISPELLRTPEQGAETTIWLASSEEVKGITGKYFYDKKEIMSSPKSYDSALAEKLWEISSKLVKL